MLPMCITVDIVIAIACVAFSLSVHLTLSIFTLDTVVYVASFSLIILITIIIFVKCLVSLFIYDASTMNVNVSVFINAGCFNKINNRRNLLFSFFALKSRRIGEEKERQRSG